MIDLLQTLLVLYLLGALPAILVFVFRPPEKADLNRTVMQSIKYMAWEALFTVFLWPYAVHRYINRKR